MHFDRREGREIVTHFSTAAAAWPLAARMIFVARTLG
jgi:hypothetical protein